MKPFLTYVITLFFLNFSVAQITLEEILPDSELNCFNVTLSGELGALKEIYKDSDNLSAYQIINQKQNKTLEIYNVDILDNHGSAVDLNADNYHIILDIGSGMSMNDRDRTIDYIHRLSRNYLNRDQIKGNELYIYFLGYQLELIHNNNYFPKRDSSGLIRKYKNAFAPNSNFEEISRLLDGSKKIILISNGYYNDSKILSDNAKAEYLGLKQAVDQISPEFNINFYCLSLSNNYNNFLDDISDIFKVSRFPAIPSIDQSYSEETNPKLVLQLKPTNLSDKNQFLLGSEQRNLVIEFSDGSISKPLDSQLFPIKKNLISNELKASLDDLTFSFCIGLFVLIFCFSLVPIYNRYRFKKNHISKYSEVKKSNSTAKDPYTHDEFQCDDQVVTINDKFMSLDSWKILKNKPEAELFKNYEEFFHNKLDGSIFEQSQSEFKSFFWLFFTFLGILVSWTAYYATELFGSEIFKAIDNTIIYELPILSGIPLAKILFFGIYSVLGVNVSIWVGNNITQRNLSKFKNLIQTSFLVIIGFWISIVIVYFIFTKVWQNPLILNIFCWLGLSFWLSYLTSQIFKLNIKDYVQFIVITSLIACSVNGLIYAFFPSLLSGFSIFLISMFIISIGLANLIASTSDSELYFGLMILHPSAQAGKVINLNLDTEIYDIGNAPDSDIYIKWPDHNIFEKHAKLKKRTDSFEIEPIQGNIFLNDVQIELKSKVKIGDVISFGSESVTQFKFINVDAKDLLENAKSYKKQSLKDKAIPPQIRLINTKSKIRIIKR